MDFIDNYQEISSFIDKNTPFIIFKHSTRCSLSAQAKKEFEEFIQESNPTYTAIKVIEERVVSNKIAENTGITHQSPQAILMKGEEILWHASHQAITTQELNKQWNKHA